jgi:putative flippase GtrA
LAELIRYIINGVFATSIHFGILTFNMDVLNVSSAGLANFIASIFGITTSFIGSRYYVFRVHKDTLREHYVRFVSLYIFLAMLHGVVLLVWTDWWMLDYRIGFLLATAVQVSISYVGNKKLVFKV